MRYLLILSMFFLLSCSEDDNLCCSQPTTMTISNNKVDESIIRVALVGYDFNNLNILYGQSKTFVFDEGIQGGYTNVNVNFETNCYGVGYGISKSVTFLEGGNTTITLNDCPEAECDCVQFSFSG